MSLIDTIKSWFSKSDDHGHDHDHPHDHAHDEAVATTAGMPPEPSAAAAPPPPTADEVAGEAPSDEE
jgi:hypothetical protein